MHRMEITGLAFVAVLAVGAMTASAASATDFCTKIKGSQGNPFQDVTLSKCVSEVGKGKSKSYKSATGLAEALYHGDTFVWSNSGAKMEFSITSVEDLGQRSCAKHNELVRTEGVVTGATTEAGVSKVGEEVEFVFCVNTLNANITTRGEAGAVW